MKTLVNGNHTFEIVNSIPQGYTIWRIGANMTDGYLPLCQVYEGTTDVNTNTLKAIKCEGAQLILRCSANGQNTIKKMETYIKRNADTKKEHTRKRVERTIKALVYMKELKFD